jgi:hypothetical protein
MELLILTWLERLRVKGDVAALASQVSANTKSFFKYFGWIWSSNDAHNLGVDKVMLLHLLQTLPRSNGVLSRRAVR